MGRRQGRCPQALTALRNVSCASWLMHLEEHRPAISHPLLTATAKQKKLCVVHSLASLFLLQMKMFSPLTLVTLVASLCGIGAGSPKGRWGVGSGVSVFARGLLVNLAGNGAISQIPDGRRRPPCHTCLKQTTRRKFHPTNCQNALFLHQVPMHKMDGTKL